MKKSIILKSLIVLFSIISFISCETEPLDSAIDLTAFQDPNNPIDPANPTDPNNPNGGGSTGGGVVSGFAMTAKINGLQFQANNPFGNNKYSSTNIWSYFPLADFVMLQGRQGGIFGNPEINIWLKRTDIVVGSYSFGAETFNTPPSHFIDLIDNSTADGEYTESGTIIITEINSSTKTIKGTFEFTSVDEPNGSPVAVINSVVTNGTFNYIYMD